ncbi:hypothetical protein U9M48_011852, partial [Paspalum notatum var. saurae]
MSAQVPSDAELLQAQADLWRHSLLYLTPMALRCAVELGIPKAIYNLGGGATAAELITALSLPPSKLPFLRRLLQLLAASGVFTADDATYRINAVSYLLLDGVPGDDRHIDHTAFVLTATSARYMDAAMDLAGWFKKDVAASPFEALNGATLFHESMESLDADFHGAAKAALEAHDNLGIEIAMREFRDLFEGIESTTYICGYGDDKFARVLVKAFPHIRCTVLAYPNMIDAATKKAAGGVINYVEGDMFSSIPPSQTVVLKLILHHWPDEDCVKILSQCRKAIPPRKDGGKVLIGDIVIDYSDSKTMLETHLLMDVGMMTMTKGRQRDENEWRQIFMKAGFSDYKILKKFGARGVFETINNPGKSSTNLFADKSHTTLHNRSTSYHGAPTTMSAEANTLPVPSDAELLQAQADLWRHSLCYLTPMALRCAVELGIPTAIYNLGGGATAAELITALSLPSSKLPFLRRLLRLLAASGVFTADATTYRINAVSYLLVDGVADDDRHINHKAFVLTATSTRYMDAAMGLAGWFKKDVAAPAFEDVHGATLLHESMESLDADFHGAAKAALEAHDNLGIEIAMREFRDLFEGIESMTYCCGAYGDDKFARVLVKAFPHVRCTVLAYPNMIDAATKQAAGGVINYVEGDMFSFIPPSQTVVLKLILHHWTDEDCVKILSECRKAIPPRKDGGKVLIGDIVIDYSDSKTMLETYLLIDVGMMTMTKGRQRDENEWRQIFMKAGFSDYKILKKFGARAVPSDAELLQAQADLWRHSLSYLTAMSLRCAVEMGIPTAIYNLGGAATPAELITALSLPSSKLPFLRRLLRLLAASGVFTADDDAATTTTYRISPVSYLLVDGNAIGGGDARHINHASLVLTAASARSVDAAMGLAGWFRKDAAAPPFDELHGATAIVAAFPHIRCTVLAYPNMIDAATIQAAGGVINYVEGDLLSFIPPAQTVMLKLVLHHWTDEDCVKILSQCRKAIPPRKDGGKVIIGDIVIDYSGSKAMLETHLLMDIGMMTMTRGRQRDENEWRKIFMEAGFSDYKILRKFGARGVFE